MIIWKNQKVGKYPLTLTTPVRVQYRDGSISKNIGTVADHHGGGDECSNWYQCGEPEDIVAYQEIAA